MPWMMFINTSRRVSQPAMSTDAAYRMARSMRSFSKVLMPCSRTLLAGNRSFAPTMIMFAPLSSSTELQPGTTAPTRAALFCISMAGIAASRVALAGPPRHRVPAKAVKAMARPCLENRAIRAVSSAAPASTQLMRWSIRSLARTEKLRRRKPSTRVVGRLATRQGSGSPRPSARRVQSSSSSSRKAATCSFPVLTSAKLRLITPLIRYLPSAPKQSSSAAGAANRVSLSASKVSAFIISTSSWASAPTPARASTLSGVGAPHRPRMPFQNTRQFTAQATASSTRFTAR